VSVDPRREERRLQRIFQHARWLAVALPLGCSAEAPVTASPPTLPTPKPPAQPAISSGAGGGAGEVETDAPPAASFAPEARAPAVSCAPTTILPDPPDECGNYVRLACGLPPGVVPGSNCYLFINDCKKVCPGFYFNCHAVNDSCKSGQIVKDATGGIDVDCSVCANGVGRTPAGLAPARRARASAKTGAKTGALGGWFAAVAHLEAASVHAFRRLHGELAAHRAPARLLRATRRARGDEVRHARLTGRMARRFGGAPEPVDVAPLPVRPLETVAIENAVEGCVRETFGALVASFQATRATDPEIARLMRSIARDETRHAALSWAVAQWASDRLDAVARARLADQVRGAVGALRRDAEASVPADLVTRAGLPDGGQQRALLGALEELLWRRLAQ